MLNELTALVPDNIFLSKIERDDYSIKLSGSAPTDADVTLFRKAIESSPSFYQLSVNQISSEKNATQVSFQLEMLQKE